VARLLVVAVLGQSAKARKTGFHNLVDRRFAVVSVNRAVRKAGDAFGIDQSVVECSEQKLAAPDQALAIGIGKTFGDSVEKGAAGGIEGTGDDRSGILIAFSRKDGPHAGEFSPATVEIR